MASGSASTAAPATTTALRSARTRGTPTAATGATAAPRHAAATVDALLAARHGTGARTRPREW